jgi:amino-acid N-acetyltransferase
MDTQQYVNWFRHSSPYINAHRGKTFVLMLPGEAIAHSNCANIIHDIALLNSLGVRLVLVHGARPQIESRTTATSTFHNGLRITDEATLESVKDAVGSTRTDIEAMFSMGLPNSPMHGARIRLCSGNFVAAKPLGIHDGVDYLLTGQVRKIDAEAIRQLLLQEIVVLLSPLGYSSTGEIFNLPLEEVAVRTAISLQADKLIAFDELAGIKSPQNELIRELSLPEAEELSLREQHANLNAIISACKGGVSRSHLISFQHDGALLQELFTRDGAGTLISQHHFEQIRSASIEDVGGIIELIEPLELDGTLVRRSRELLENEINYFTVIERDGTVIACAALYPYSEQKAEIACVVTHPDYQGGKRAARLLEFMEKRARQQQIKQLFVLTTRTAHWFLEQGFVQKELGNLPQKKQQLYNFQRNSKIFCKDL